MSNMLELILEAHTLTITLNRPEVLNALSLELLQELKESLQEASEQKEVRAILLIGKGRGFCAGADLSSTPLDQNVASIVETYYNPVIRLLATMPKPVIAAINGVAAGAGLSLALACDVRLMSEQANLTVGFTKIGLSLDAGMSYFLPKLVGRGKAFELSYSNRNITSNEALSLGLVETVLPADSFHEAAFRIANDLAQGPYSLALVKQLLNSDDLDKQLRLEATLQAQAAQSSDAREGIMAFVQKRKAGFKGE
jgi:2-(1,2-epoxy-1,2-dihydrophenyl)acetyl-CoA isomerase